MPDFTDYVSPKVDALMDKLANFRRKVVAKSVSGFVFGFGDGFGFGSGLGSGFGAVSGSGQKGGQMAAGAGVAGLSADVDANVPSMTSNGEVSLEERFAKTQAEEDALNERIYGKNGDSSSSLPSAPKAPRAPAAPVSKPVEKTSDKPILKSRSGKAAAKDGAKKGVKSAELNDDGLEMERENAKQNGKGSKGDGKGKASGAGNFDDDAEGEGDLSEDEVGGSIESREPSESPDSPEDVEMRKKLEQTSWSRVKSADQLEADAILKTASNGFSKLRSMSAEDILSGRHDISEIHIFSSNSLKLKPQFAAERDAEHEQTWRRIQQIVAGYGNSKLVMSTQNMVQLANIIAKSANRDRIMESIMCDNDVMGFFTSRKKDYKYLITRSEGREFGHYVPDYSRDSTRMFEEFFCNPGKMLRGLQQGEDAGMNAGAIGISGDLKARFRRNSFTDGTDDYFSSGFLTTKPAVKVEEGNAKLLTLPNMAFDHGGSERGKKMAQIMHANCKANRGKTFITTVAVTSPKTSGHDIVLCCESSPKNGDIERILVSDSMVYNYDETLYMLEPAIEELFKAGALSKPLANLVKEARKLDWDHDKICENKKLMQKFLKLCPEPAGDLQKTQSESSNMCMRNSLDNAFDLFLAAKDGKLETDENGRMSERQRRIMMESNPVYSTFDPKNGAMNNRVVEAFRTYVNNDYFFAGTMDSIRAEMTLKSTRKPEDITTSVAIIASKIFGKEISPSDVNCSLDIKDKGVVMDLKIKGCSSHQFDMVIGDMLENSKIDAIRDVSYASASASAGSSPDPDFVKANNNEIMAKIRANMCDRLDQLAHDDGILNVAANAAKKEDDIGKLQVFKNMICEFLVKHGLQIKRERHIVLANKSAYLDSSFSKGEKSVKAIVHSSQLQKEVSKMEEGHLRTINKQKRRSLERQTRFSTEDKKSPNAFSSKEFGTSQAKDASSLDGDGDKDAPAKGSGSGSGSSGSDSGEKKSGFVERLKKARAAISEQMRTGISA